MAYFPQPHCSLRAPRVRLANPPRIVFLVENTRIDGTLQRLSLTGGSARVAQACTAGDLAELKINTPSGRMEALVEMLAHSEIGEEQAFRFVAMGDLDQEMLLNTVSRMRSMGYAEGSPGAGF